MAVATQTGHPSSRRATKRPRPRRSGPAGGRALSYLILLVVTIICAAPFVWMLSASLEPLGQIFAWPPHWLPTHPTLHNYTAFLSSGSNIGRWFLNSALVAGSVTIIQTFLSALAAYALSKRRFPGRNLIFYLFIGTMMFPGAILFIPNYIVLKHIPLFGGNDLLGQGGHGWLNSYLGLIIPAIISPFSIFLLRQYMKTIPDTLLDAARIDGGSEFWIFWRVVLPLSRPALAAVAIFTFGYFWQDFLWPLIVINSPNLYTLPLGLGLFVQQNKTVWDLLMAGSVISVGPVIILFIIFQRQFIQGIALSGMKG